MPKEIKTSCRASHQAFLDLYNQTPNKEEVVQSIIDGELKEGDLYLAYRKTGLSDKNVGIIHNRCGCRVIIDADSNEVYDTQTSERRMSMSGSKFLEWVKNGGNNLDEILELTQYESIGCQDHSELDIEERFARLQYEGDMINKAIQAADKHLGDEHFKSETDPDTGDILKIRKTPLSFQFDGDTLMVDIEATAQEKASMSDELSEYNITING